MTFSLVKTLVMMMLFFAKSLYIDLRRGNKDKQTINVNMERRW